MLTLTVQNWRASPQDLADELVAGHVRALQVGPLFEVASSDRHTVKPWFQGRLDYAPPVLGDLPGGFILLGGRVQALEGRPTAVLAYRSACTGLTFSCGMRIAVWRRKACGGVASTYCTGALV